MQYLLQFYKSNKILLKCVVSRKKQIQVRLLSSSLTYWLTKSLKLIGGIMKKKLLTVLLAVVMVFGVFGLTACGGSNPADDYNYYGVKYELEDEVKIFAVTYSGVQNIIADGSAFLLMLDDETGNAKERFQKVNAEANKLGVTVAHFNPDLLGGFNSEVAKAELKVEANIMKDLSAPKAAGAKTYQDNLISILKLESLADLQKLNNKVLAIKGGLATKASYLPTSDSLGQDSKYVSVSMETFDWYGVSQGFSNKLVAAVDPANLEVAVANIAERKPSFAGIKVDGKIDVANAFQIKESMKMYNHFGNGTFHIYNTDLNDESEKNFTAEKTDVYVTVANYGMFAHLIANNPGEYFVFFGGPWCPNTRAITKAVNDLAKASSVPTVYFFDPRIYDGATGVTNLNTRNNGDKSNDIHFTYAYADFLDKYLPEYSSNWNYGVKLVIDSSKGDDKEYTKMCVPNMMAFDGSKAIGSKLFPTMAEAEYTWGNVSVEGNAQQVAWYESVIATFEQGGTYTYIAPIAEEAPSTDAGTSGGSSSGGSSSGGSTGGDAGGC